MSNQKSTAFFTLALAAIVFSVLPSLPFGDLVQWPFVILTTFVHEMGHGLAAIAVGDSFIKLELFSNGGGLAYHRGFASGWQSAVIAAGGLLAPSIAGGLFILTGRSQRTASVILLVFAVFMLVSCALWVRTTFGLVTIIGLGVLFLFLSLRSGKGVHQFLIQFFAVHMLVDTLTRTMRYLFTSNVNFGSGVSDTSVIAQSVGGSYVLWGVVIAATALSIFYLSFRSAYLR